MPKRKAKTPAKNDSVQGPGARTRAKTKRTNTTTKRNIINELQQSGDEENQLQQSDDEENQLSDDDQEEQKTPPRKPVRQNTSGALKLLQKQRIQNLKQLNNTLDAGEVTTFLRQAYNVGSNNDYSFSIEAIKTFVHDNSAHELIDNTVDTYELIDEKTFNEVCEQLYTHWLGEACAPYRTLEQEFLRLPKRTRGMSLVDYAKGIQDKLDLINWCRRIFRVHDTPQWRLPLLTSWVKGLNCQAAANTTTNLNNDATFRDYLGCINAFLRLNPLDPKETQTSLNFTNQGQIQNGAPDNNATQKEMINVVKKCEETMERLHNLQTDMLQQQEQQQQRRNSCTFCPSPQRHNHTLEECRSKNRRNNRFNQQNQDRFPGECFKCGRSGHKSADCRARQCNNCGSYRHRSCNGNDNNYRGRRYTPNRYNNRDEPPRERRYSDRRQGDRDRDRNKDRSKNE